MRNSILISVGVLIAVAGCSQPKEEPVKKSDEALPYRFATATEVFNLRSQCAKLGDVLLDEDVIGLALRKDVASHYNPKTNRCYVEVTVMPVDETSPDSSDYLYDGQTKEMLAYMTTKAGKKAYMNVAMLPTGDPREANTPAEEKVLDAIRLAMDDDRKN